MPSVKPSDASSPTPSLETQRLPPWLRVKLPRDATFGRTRALLGEMGLCTVCQSARCPNVFECFGKGVATFLVLGGVCTRGCAFCNVTPGVPEPPDPDEPARLAKAAARLGLRHVVVTSVTRDDLPDGGAAHFAAVIGSLRAELPEATVEVLTPDFLGDARALETVLAAGPDVFNHNLETVPELYSRARRGADYARSLDVLRRAAGRSPFVRTKSGLMLGLGETREQLVRTLSDLAEVGCSMVTVGQYLRPSRRNLPVARYVPPEEFDEVADLGRSLGIPVMYCGPLVRSSHAAGDLLHRAQAGAE
ncbi:lipoyl synthase [Fundidesulfovibrio butyratiphilus]